MVSSVRLQRAEGRVEVASVTAVIFSSSPLTRWIPQQSLTSRLQVRCLDLHSYRLTFLRCVRRCLRESLGLVGEKECESLLVSACADRPSERSLVHTAHM